MLALFAAALPTAVVLQPVANMYSRPSTDADVVSQAIYGANVGILEQKDGWAHIRTADDYLGLTSIKTIIWFTVNRLLVVCDFFSLAAEPWTSAPTEMGG